VTRSTVALLALAVVAGCQGSADEQRTRTLARIDALRDATSVPLEHRLGLLVALEALKTDAADATAARDACLEAYRPLLAAQELEANATGAMASGKKVDTIAVARQLDDATRLLERSRELMPACDQAASRLRASRP
jgi:hypothetical protein